jgi:hypothetical protein
VGLITGKSTSRRARRRNEAKALKHKAALEAKYSSRNDRKRIQAERRASDKVAKAQVAALQAQEKASLAQAAKVSREWFSAGQVRKYLGVARVLVPVLLPLAYRGATWLRGELDRRRARSLGVEVDRLVDFTGHGAKLSARIAGAEASARDLSARHSADAEISAFADTSLQRLRDLAGAVRAAEQMPVPQRRSAHTSIAQELSAIESGLLRHLGV